MPIKKLSLFLVVFLLAAAFRFTGINWDANQHLHPDERFLTMVANGTSWPKTITEYLDTQTSPLNPHNAGFSFYVYGTFPLFLVKAVAEGLSKGDYNNLTLVGRVLSGLFDLGTLILVFFIAKRFSMNDEPRIMNRSPFVAIFFYAIMLLPIQLSHFFTVDPHLTFFLTLSFFTLLTIHNSVFSILFLGFSFGLAIASKISALLLLPVIGAALLYWFWKKRSLTFLIVSVITFLASAYATVRLADPYLFADGNLINPTINPAVLANWKQLKDFDGPQTTFPPALQWISSTPILDPLRDIMVSGVGFPIGILAIIAILYQVSRKQTASMTLMLFWIFLLFGYQSIQFAKPLRYFYPLYPMLAVASGLFVSRFIRNIGNIGSICLLVVLSLWPLSFIIIYTRPHTRITASEWIYANIPKGSTIAWEYWDDPLPLCLPAEALAKAGLPNIQCGQYTLLSLPLYDQDTPAKWQKINAILEKTDYLILSSNRLYGSITNLPNRYPLTGQYYQSLFNGSLGFTKIAQFTSRPTLPNPFLSLCIPIPGNSYGIVAKSVEECTNQGISIIDEYAEESYTAYDHPKVVIFKKNLP
ncbi:hypothetical protein HY948_04225 [Candidatus Gottesmanbacteria bacterium]|nr:hypothetical protein [Candidatus Gottesmanbacteria bacterium]